MANDCLVTKLSSVVNNDNLKKLGIFEFTVTMTAGQPMTLGFEADANTPVELIIDGDATFNSGIAATYVDSKHIYIWEGKNYYSSIVITAASAGDVKIQAKSEYNIRRLYQGNYDTPLKKLISTSRLSSLVETEEFGLLSTQIEGNISELKALKKATSIQITANSDNTNLTGSILAFSELKNLSYLRLTHSRGIEGNLNDLLDNLYAAGKRGGLEVNLTYTPVTYTGNINIYTTAANFIFDDNGWSEVS